MRKILFILSTLLTTSLCASVLQPILSGDFAPLTLSVQEQDSILNTASEPGRYTLEYENAEQLFRHSFVADWYIVDKTHNTRKPLGAALNLGKVRDAVLSPNGRYIAFAKDNNLYIHKLDFGTEVAVTKDANPDIINGIADWLYEEEFGITTLFAWSPDSKQLAFIRLDETQVPSFEWQTFLGNAVKENNSTYPQYPSSASLRYPKAGCANAKASVCVYDVGTKAIMNMQVNKNQEDLYFPRMRWAAETLLVMRLNRDQTKMEILSCNAKSTVVHPLYKEESKKYFIDYALFDQWLWLADGSFVVLHEQDGWRRAYLYSAQGIQQKVLTPDQIDVTALYGVNESAQLLYYQAAPTPSTRQVYAVSIKSATAQQCDTPTPLTTGEGTHTARFSKDYKRMIDCFQSFDTPNTYSLYTVSKRKATRLESILDNNAIKQQWESYQLTEPELLSIPNANGQTLEAMLLRPKQTNAADKYPLVVMHYSGPQSQRVLNRWRKRFEYALAEEGYMVLIVDTRGTDCKGRAWRNETYMNLGTKEAQDLIAAAQWASQQSYIDANKMAIMGWSYGGYQSLMTMSTKGHPYKACVAIAPVTDWKLYDSAYTERYMRRPQVNDYGYQNASLIHHVNDISGNILIIHGTADDNVHVQHVMQYCDALVKADKDFEMQLYTDDNHFLRNGKNYTHLHRRVLSFLRQHLQ